MDQKTEMRGNFTMNLNFLRKTNDRAPAITGRISSPETPDVEQSFSAFEQVDEKGERYWIGPVEPTSSIRQALHAEAERGSHFVAIRMNSFKVFKTLPDGQPNPVYAELDSEAKQAEDLKPDFWATWTRDPKATPQLRCAAWERAPGRYGPWASGHTQHPKSREQIAQEQDTAIDMSAPTSDEAPTSRRRKTSERSGR